MLPSDWLRPKQATLTTDKKYLPLIFNLIYTDTACPQYCNYCTYLYSSYLAFNIWPWRGIFVSAFRRQLVHHRVPGRYKSMLFPTSSKTWNSLAGIGVRFIALEWPGKGQERYCLWPSIWQTKFPRSTFDLFVYLFQDLYSIYIPTRFNHLVKR